MKAVSLDLKFQIDRGDRTCSVTRQLSLQIRGIRDLIGPEDLI